MDSLSATTLLNALETLDANNPDCGDLLDGPGGRVALEQLRFVHQNQSIQGQVRAVWSQSQFALGIYSMWKSGCALFESFVVIVIVSFSQSM